MTTKYRALALTTMLAACGGSSATTDDTTALATESTGSETTGSALTFHQAIDIAAAVHATATPIVVERDELDGQPVLEVKLLEAGTLHIVKIDLAGAIVADEPRAIDEGEAEEMRMLAEEAASRPDALRTGLTRMIETYGERALHEVELEMHGVTLVLEAAVDGESGRQIQVHDPDTGVFMMTED